MRMGWNELRRAFGRFGSLRSPRVRTGGIKEGYFEEFGFSATYPHCDANVLHAPGECIYCDHYPIAQKLRIEQKINFTGHYDPDKVLCPAERSRPLDTINRWHGNIAMTEEQRRLDDEAMQHFLKDLEDHDLLPKNL